MTKTFEKSGMKITTCEERENNYFDVVSIEIVNVAKFIGWAKDEIDRKGRKGNLYDQIAASSLYQEIF